MDEQTAAPRCRLCITFKEDESFHIEDIDEHGTLRRITIELRRSNRGTAQVAITAPDSTVIRRNHITFAGQCEECARLLRPSRHHELTDAKMCRACRDTT